MTMISSFKGDNDFLSNFYPVTVILDGVWYPSVEHAYQAAKTTDLEARKAFESGTAAESKKLGRALKIRSDWEEVKLSVMRGLLRQKFAPDLNAEPTKKLLATQPHDLVEGNWWGDTFWGVCKGKGENHLGKLLMEIRAERQAGKNAYGGGDTRGMPGEGYP